MSLSIPYSDLTYQIIGAAMRIHNRLGPGHKEVIYQRALTQELLASGLSVQEEKAYTIYTHSTSS